MATQGAALCSGETERAAASDLLNEGSIERMKAARIDDCGDPKFLSTKEDANQEGEKIYG
jgi:hypothetical protein